MALANVAVYQKAGGDPGNPLFAYDVTLDFDADYRTGGYTNFHTTLAAVASIGAGKTILAVVGVDTKGYQVAYNSATHALLVYTGDYNPAADSPLVECDDHENLGAVTGVRLLVLAF